MTRQTAGRIVVWSFVLSWSFFLAGHCYEMIVLVPNWSSGSIEEVGTYHRFLSHSGPGRFFLLISVVVMMTSLAAIAAAWRATSFERLLSLVPLAVLILYGVWTQTYFVPINHYVGRGVYDSVVLKSKVEGWVYWEYWRAGLVARGLAASVWLTETRRDSRL